MPLQAIGPMMRRAASEQYAVGYFESWSLESLQGVVDAAEAARAPVILGFNGAFLSSDRRASERLAIYAAVGKAAAESASVPCGLIFNECPRDDWVLSAIELGFNLVMLADPAADPEAVAGRVAEIVRVAHGREVAVEGEVGELPYGAGAGAASGDAHGGSATDPIEAAEFVARTGVDLLAVSVGNVHIKTRGDQGLDLALLERIAERVPVPLVLHGGTGISPRALSEAVSRGVTKVNFGTYLKQRYLQAVRLAIGHDCPDPHRLLGMGGREDVLMAGRMAVRDAVLERIELLGCGGKAASQ
jgi:fructose/tagatose bisphosphate aldolase